MKVGLVGLGNAGRTLHLPALRGLPAATLVGTADPDATRREAATRKTGVPKCATLAELRAFVEGGKVV